MPRKGHIAKRDVLPDPIYNSKVVTRTINAIMLDVKEQTGQDPLEVFTKALENISPVLEVKSRRIGGQNYQVPIEVRPERKQTLALRWLVKYSRLRSDKTMDVKLAKEIMDAANGLGGACKKRDEMHKMAEANKAFAHYRW